MLTALRTDNSPFSESQLRQLKQSIGALDTAQAQWLSGYLAGRLADAGAPQQATAKAPATPALISILYGSETGNGEGIAAELAGEFERSGIRAELLSLDGFRPGGLRKLKHAVFVVSTHGEGDPPEEALDLFEYLDGERAPDLGGLNYRVLALGDRSYSLFCAAGRKLDQRLHALGARRIGPRVECDVDFFAKASAWSAEVLDFARQHLATQTWDATAPSLSVVPDAPRWTRDNPFHATLERAQQITGAGSDKDVWHLELSLVDSGLTYQPGDALGVWAPNDPQLVVTILSRLHIDATARVSLAEDQHREQMDVAQALVEHREITRLSNDTVKNYAQRAGLSALQDHFGHLDARQQREFIETRQFADLAEEYPAKLSAQDLVDLLRPLAPRSYSIASSPDLIDDEVHLTVATLGSNAIGIPRAGVASHYLNHRLKAGAIVRVFPEPNRRFRLPDKPRAPLIMIAAGTGIAPFRAFMQQREQQKNSSGQIPGQMGAATWLIFGNPHLRSDFLYQKEWLHWRETGLLDRIDVAFSRDQAEKRYVQHVVTEQAGRIERWLQRGAHIYICGALSMGQAVQAALRDVLAEQRGIDPPAAAAALAELRRDRRLQKDLY